MAKSKGTTSLRVRRETRELLRKVEEQLSLSARGPVSVDRAILALVTSWPDRRFTLKGTDNGHNGTEAQG